MIIHVSTYQLRFSNKCETKNISDINQFREGSQCDRRTLNIHNTNLKHFGVMFIIIITFKIAQLGCFNIADGCF